MKANYWDCALSEYIAGELGRDDGGDILQRLRAEPLARAALADLLELKRLLQIAYGAEHDDSLA